jgi:hypothetical protein
MGTIHEALKQLYYSLGGNADDVRNADDPVAIILKMAALAIGESIAAASVKELPTLPTDDGTYQLQVVIADGEDPVYSWEAVE